MIRALAKAIIIGAIQAVRQVNLSPKRELAVEDATDDGYLPQGHPVVSFSPRAEAMRAEPFRIRESQIAETTGPRVGSYQWRLQQARAIK